MISSTSNQQIKAIVQLNKKAKARRELRAFVIEGTKMFAETPSALLRKVYVTEHFLEKEEQRVLLEKSGADYETVSEGVFAHMSDTSTPQGILALVRMPEYAFLELLYGRGGVEGKTIEPVRNDAACGNAVRVECAGASSGEEGFSGKAPRLLVLEDIQDPGNLGTMFRTAEGAGMSGIIMSRNTVDLFSPKTVRATMGSIYRVPFYVSEDLRETLRALAQAGICIYATHLQGSFWYDEPDYTKPCAFLIGNEGNGLKDETAACADTLVKIPMQGRLESLNAGVAAGIFMYEAYRQCRKTDRT